MVFCITCKTTWNWLPLQAKLILKQWICHKNNIYLLPKPYIFLFFTLSLQAVLTAHISLKHKLTQHFQFMIIPRIYSSFLWHSMKLDEVVMPTVLLILHYNYCSAVVILNQPVFTYSKSTTESPEQCVKYIQSWLWTSKCLLESDCRNSNVTLASTS